MRGIVKAPKDFWIGVVYVGIGLAAFLLGRNYQMGTASRMGPGYFPVVLSVILIVIGGLSLLRSCRSEGDPLQAIAAKPLILILASCKFFAVLLPRTGLIVALSVLALVSASASVRFRLEWKATAGLVLLVICCVLVFVTFLGIPMPLMGTWLEPILGPIFPSIR